MKFTDFNFEPALQEGLQAMRFENPTPIQQQAIPEILKGQDIIAVAQTGTGKTASFLLPVLNELCKNNVTTCHTLIVVPTRELALQIDQAVQGFAYFTGASSISIIGGGDGGAFEQEKRALTDGVNIIIATPGRLTSHLNMGYVKFGDIKTFVLDEADKMMDMGFVHEINKINTFLPEKKQTLLFSATMPISIRRLSEKLLKNPFPINIAVSKPAEGITQHAFLVYDADKITVLKHVLKENTEGRVLIFASTKLVVKNLYKELKSHQVKVKAIHSDLEQSEREEVLMAYRNMEFMVLVATDILSRGIDIEDINLVINYDVPGDAEDYIHRIGRTARAGSKGRAVTFINETDRRRFFRIEQLMEKTVEKLPLPEGTNPGPDYNPELMAAKQGGKRPFKGKRPFNKGKRPPKA